MARIGRPVILCGHEGRIRGVAQSVEPGVSKVCKTGGEVAGDLVVYRQSIRARTELQCAKNRQWWFRLLVVVLERLQLRKSSSESLASLA
jgi:hypothetical protein